MKNLLGIVTEHVFCLFFESMLNLVYKTFPENPNHQNRSLKVVTMPASLLRIKL